MSFKFCEENKCDFDIPKTHLEEECDAFSFDIEQNILFETVFYRKKFVKKQYFHSKTPLKLPGLV